MLSCAGIHSSFGLMLYLSAGSEEAVLRLFSQQAGTGWRKEEVALKTDGFLDEVPEILGDALSQKNVTHWHC